MNKPTLTIHHPGTSAETYHYPSRAEALNRLGASLGLEISRELPADPLFVRNSPDTYRPAQCQCCSPKAGGQ